MINQTRNEQAMFCKKRKLSMSCCDQGIDMTEKVILNGFMPSENNTIKISSWSQKLIIITTITIKNHQQKFEGLIVFRESYNAVQTKLEWPISGQRNSLV